MTFEKQYPDKTFSFPETYGGVYYNTYNSYLTLPAFKKIYSINMSPTQGYGGIWFVPASISDNKLTFRAFNGTNKDYTTAYCMYATGTWK